MLENKLIPVLVIEDCDFTNALIEEITQGVPHLEIITATTKEDAMKVLHSRNDIKVAFVDWFLENGTSEWIIKDIQATQLQITEIFATSSNDDKRSMQILCEWATGECSKWDILHRLDNIHEIVQ